MSEICKCGHHVDDHFGMCAVLGCPCEEFDASDGSTEDARIALAISEQEEQYRKAWLRG
jgi:hypothetical protein